MDRPFSDFILKTRLFAPQSRRPEIMRAALVERLHAGSESALTLISAPAGFGKTTLLTRWISEKGRPAAWLSLDSEDNFPVRFLTYLAASLNTIGRISDETVQILQKSQNIPPRTILSMLLQELESAPSPFWLVLDDYHLITERPVHELLHYLLDHLPPRMHLVIATRVDPPIPLARLRTHGDLFELRAADLRFSTEEAGLFLNQQMGLDLTPEEIEQLEQRTEGWIAGLQMAALALQGPAQQSQQDKTKRAAFLAGFSGSHRFILDYLMEEVITQQPDEVQNFLLRTSILDRFCAGICAQVVQPPEAEPQPEEWCQQILNRLERDNLFLFPLDDERKWYRYHHLFRDLLRARLQQTQPQIIPSLHLLAAMWLEQQGELTKAIQHAFNAGEYELAADWMERCGQERWAQSDTAFLTLVWQMPSQILLARPALGICSIWTSFLYGQQQSAAALLQVLREKLISSPENGEIRSLRAFADLLFLYFADLTRREVQLEIPGPRALEDIPPSLLGMRNTADVILAILHSARGSFDAAENLLQEAIRRDIAAGGTTAVPISASLLARNQILQGRLIQAEKTCREYIEFVSRSGAWRYYLSGNLYLTLGDVLEERNRLDEAEKAIQTGIALNEPWNIPTAAAMGAAALARLQLSQGNMKGAQETLQSGLQAFEDRFVPPENLDDLRASQANLWLEAGELEPVEAWVNSLPAYHPGDCRQERVKFVLVRYRLAQGKTAAALGILESLETAARAQGRWGSLVRILLWQAQTADQTGDQQTALQRLDACLDLAAPAGYLRVFLNRGAVIERLLTAYLRWQGSHHKDYAQLIIDAFHLAASGAAPGSKASLVEPLSTRELEVLALVCKGLSNQAIAEQLFITVSAVKKHTGNIFGKLGVSNRTQAVLRARELGLVSKA